MASLAHDLTNTELEKLEKKLLKEYQQAEKELKKRAEKHMKAFKLEDAKMYKKYMKGQITLAEYRGWAFTQMQKGQWLDDMVAAMSNEITNVNQVAAKMINSALPQVYAENFNFGTFQVEKAARINTSFSLYSREAVAKVLKGRPKLVPQAKIDIPKDLKWNQRHLRSALTQSILQGEGALKTAKRLQKAGMKVDPTQIKGWQTLSPEKLSKEVARRNQITAVRNARTMMTAAENAGKLDSYRRAESMGIPLEKMWSATMDDRTRDSHAFLDGVTVPVEEAFPNGLMYPADPSGSADEVWNCRCELSMQLKGFERDMTNLANRNTDHLNENTYEEWKAARMTEASRQKAAAELKTHKYNNIWKDTVTPADYAAKKASIEAKRQYFDNEIAKAQKYGKTGAENYFKQLKADLNRFEQEGKQYEAYISAEAKKLQQQAAQKAVPKAAPKASGDPFDASAYTAARRSAAYDFTDKYEADKLLRPDLDDTWETLSEREQYGVWEYTHNSHPINKPLSGYLDDWDRSAFKGLGNVPWGREDNWRYVHDSEWIAKFGKNGTSNVDYARAIKDLTLGIEKSTLKQDMWLVRGSGTDGLAGLFEGDLFTYDQAMKIITSGDPDMIRKAFVGQTFTNHAYTSTGIAHGTGFQRQVSYRIYAPKGTKGIYAEPTSYYGSTISGGNGMAEELYKKGMSSKYVSDEAEIIIQRGTQYRVTDIKVHGRNIEIEMEIVGQPKYFKTGWEETFNGGKTLHKH